MRCVDDSEACRLRGARLRELFSQALLHDVPRAPLQDASLLATQLRAMQDAMKALQADVKSLLQVQQQGGGPPSVLPPAAAGSGAGAPSGLGGSAPIPTTPTTGAALKELPSAGGGGLTQTLAALGSSLSKSDSPLASELPVAEKKKVLLPSISAKPKS